MTLLPQLLPAQAIPGAAKFIELLVVSLLLLFIIWVINRPQLRVPPDWAKVGTWIVAGALIIYLVWQALLIAGIL